VATRAIERSGLAVADPAGAARWRRRRAINAWGWRGFLTIVGLLLFGPLVILVLFSFNDSNILAFPLEGVTTKWYSEALTDPVLLKALANSFQVAFVVAPLCLVLGTLAAFGLTRFRFRGRGVIGGLVGAPLVLPWLIIGIAALMGYARADIDLSLKTVVMTQTVCTFPLVTAIVAAQLFRFQKVQEEAAIDLGCSRLQVLRHIILPHIGPALAAAGIFAFAWSFNNYEISAFVLGFQQTFPVWVYSSVRNPDHTAVVNAISALISAAQRVEHYEIAGYGSARTYARLLGDWDGSRLLQQTIEEEGDTDHRLTEIAESGVNQAAAAGERGGETEHWSRLRFVEAAAIHDEGIDYDKLSLKNNVGDDLGSLDGFVVAGDTGRPLYYVVDSGGWFVGRRYLVPVGKGRLDTATQTLVIDLDRDQIKRYPEFSTNAFLSMSEDQLRGYERRLIGSISPQASRSPAYWRSYDELPDYQQPSWLHSERWHPSGSVRPVGSIAAPESDWDGAPSTPPTPRITDTTREPEVVVASSEEERRRDPRLNEMSEGVRGIGESAPRRMDDDDMAR